MLSILDRRRKIISAQRFLKPRLSGNRLRAEDPWMATALAALSLRCSPRPRSTPTTTSSSRHPSTSPRSSPTLPPSTVRRTTANSPSPKSRSREIPKKSTTAVCSSKHPQSILSLSAGGCAGRREVGAVPSRHAAALYQRQALQRRRLQRLQRRRGIGGGVQGAALAQARLVLRERLPADGGCHLRRVQRSAPGAYVRPGLPNLTHRQEAGRGKHNIEPPPQLFRCQS